MKKVSAIESFNNLRLCVYIKKQLEFDIENAFSSFRSNGEIWKKIRNGSVLKTLKKLKKRKAITCFHIECGRKTNPNAKRGQAIGWVEYNRPGSNCIRIHFQLTTV